MTNAPRSRPNRGDRPPVWVTWWRRLTGRRRRRSSAGEARGSDATGDADGASTAGPTAVEPSATDGPSATNGPGADGSHVTATPRARATVAPVLDGPVWEVASPTATDPRLPRLDGDVHADLCVIGLGGSGLSAVAEALDVGLSVVGLDAGAVAGRATGRNGGFLLAGTSLFHHDAVRRFGRERALAWYHATVDEIDRLATADDHVRRVGSLRLASDDIEHDDIERQVAVMRRDGLAVEEFEGPEGRGLLVPTDAAMNPLSRCRRLADEVVAGGAQLFAHSAARTVSGHRVRTVGGEVRCDRVVVAIDGELGAVLPELAGRVRPVRLQMLGTAPTDEVDLPRPVYSRYGLDYWSQQPDGRIALGGGRDRGADEEEAAAPLPSPAVQAHLDELLRTRLGVSSPVTHRWAAVVGYTASSLPVCQQVRPGVWAIGGYSGTGNVIGSLLGRVVVELAARGSSDRADELFAT